MAILIEQNGTRGEFRLFENEVQAGFMRFSLFNTSGFLIFLFKP